MPYEITIQNQQDYIRVDVAGDRTPGNEAEDAISMWAQVGKNPQNPGQIPVSSNISESLYLTLFFLKR